MLVDQERPEILSNISESNELKFRLDSNNPILFDILRNRLYKDKIGSVCREITDNARDAHREVGKRDVPVEITMPGSYLVIRDFGPGISPERAAEIYTVYGESTKRTSNQQGGGFGLGCKTPFAYSDTFTIETVVDGILYEYVAFIDETMIGKLTLMSQSKTDKPQGTAIRLPVKPQDRTEFAQKILFYTQYWSLFGDATPKYIGALPHEAPKVVLRGDDWLIMEAKGAVPHLFVNGIPYNLNTGWGSPLTKHWPSYVSLIFNTGEISLVASREEVHADDKTKQKLASFSNDKVVKAIAKKVNEVIKDQTDFLEVLKIIDGSKMVSEYGHGALKFEWNKTKFSWPLEEEKFQVYNGSSVYKRHKHKTLKYCEVKKISRENLFIVDKIEGGSTSFTSAISRFATKNKLDYVVLVEEGACKLFDEAGLTKFVVRKGKSYSRKYEYVNIRAINNNKLADKINLKLTRLKYIYFTKKEYKEFNDAPGLSTYSTFGRFSVFSNLVVLTDDIDVKQLPKDKFTPVVDAVKDVLKGVTQKDVDNYFLVEEIDDAVMNLKYLAKHSKNWEFFPDGKELKAEEKALIDYAIFLKLYKKPTVKPNDVMKKYPMLEHMSPWGRQDAEQQKAVIEYVKLIDSI